MSGQLAGFSHAGSFPAAFCWRLLAAVCWFVTVAGSALAQIPEPPLPEDPRPLEQLISEGDKATLAQAHDPKKLVEAYLKISDAHLQAALNVIKASASNSAASERELDIYKKALNAAGKEAFALRDGKRSVSKRMEQSLYRQIKTLDTIVRLFPGEREAFAEAALKHAKQLRVQALNEAFASGDVLKDPDGEKKPKSEPPQNEKHFNDSTPPVLTLERSTRVTGGLSLREVLAKRTPMSQAVMVSFNGARDSLQMSGDYLTEEEDDHVRAAQAADARVKVFMKIADRRLNAVAGTPAASADKKDQKKAEEEAREWGALPNVSRAELLRHYARAISECMAKLEDAYERNPKSSALPKALATLRDSTEKHLQTLRALEPEMKGDKEVAALRDAIEEAETANKGARGGLK